MPTTSATLNMIRAQPRASKLLGLILGSAFLASLAGCFKWMEPASPITPQHRLVCGSMPQFCRNHVYIFFLLGADPLDCADLGGLREHLQKLGFIKSYLAEWFYRDYFAAKIAKIHEEDKLARFALVGYRLGACEARKLAEQLHTKGQTIDLLVYLGGGPDGPRPPNVLKLLNIEGKCPSEKQSVVNPSDTVRIEEVSQKGCVSHPRTLELLVRELTLAGTRVPVVAQPLPANPFPEPTPRSLRPAPDQAKPKAGPPDEWDFLKPKSLPAPPTQSPRPMPEMLPRPTPVDPPPPTKIG